MVQVCRSCCAHTVHADSPGIQLVVAFQLVLSCSMHCSLHHPSGFISHLSSCHCCRSGVSDHARWVPSQPACSDSLLALHLDLVHSFEHRCHSHRVHGLSGTFNNILAVQNILDVSRLDLLTPGQFPTKKSFVVEDDDDWVSWFS